MAVSWWYRARWELKAFWKNLHNKRVFSLLVGTAAWSILTLIDHALQIMLRIAPRLTAITHLDHVLFGLIVGWFHGVLQKRRFEREMNEKLRFLLRTHSFGTVEEINGFVEEMLARADLDYLDMRVEQLLLKHGGD